MSSLFCVMQAVLVGKDKAVCVCVGIILVLNLTNICQQCLFPFTSCPACNVRRTEPLPTPMVALVWLLQYWQVTVYCSTDTICDGKPSIYAQQYFCNKTHLKIMGKKCKLQKKTTQVCIASLVGELSLQWIHPGHHLVRLFIGSANIFVSSPYTK